MTTQEDKSGVMSIAREASVYSEQVVGYTRNSVKVAGVVANKVSLDYFKHVMCGDWCMHRVFVFM